MYFVILFCDLFIAFLGMATFSFWLTYLAGGSFSNFKIAIVCSLAGAIAISMFTARRSVSDEGRRGDESRSALTPPCWVAAGLAAVAVIVSN